MCQIRWTGRKTDRMAAAILEREGRASLIGGPLGLTSMKSMWAAPKEATGPRL